MFAGAFGWLVLSGARGGCPSGDSELTKVMLPGTGGGHGASCLDGSPAGFYIQRTANASHANDWQLYFQGGGWCYSAVDCYGRGQTSAVGSSKKWPPASSRSNTEGAWRT